MTIPVAYVPRPEGQAALDKGIDKGKKAVEKGKDAADEIGKIIGGEKGLSLIHI